MAGKVAWFTGLSGSGKTTIALRAAELLTEAGQTVLILDGDVVRSQLHKHLGFSHEDIRENNRLIVGLGKEATADHDLVLVPIISPFLDSRANARLAFGESFVEVYVHATVAEVVSRDPKGLYREAREGKRTNIIGLSDELPYQAPTDPELVLNTCEHDAETCSRQLVDYLLSNAVPGSCQPWECEETKNG